MEDTVNWALVGTGNIVRKFIIGLRHAEGAVVRTVVSRTQEKAEAFAEEYGIPDFISSYDSVINNPDIDIVYIGTPHTSHMEYAMRALEKGKAVLCEKPMTVSRKDAEKVIECAKAHNTFFMEAVWTRFLPAMVKVREWLSDGLIGDVKLVEADFGFRAPFIPEWRLFNRELGGGSLLDVGIYPVTVSQMVYGRKPERITSSMFLGKTGVDEMTNMILDYGNGSSAVLNSCVNSNLDTVCRIYGTKGKIVIPDFVYARSAELTVYNEFTQVSSPDFISNGYNYEAEEVMKCVKQGLIESPVMPHSDSLCVLDIMDSVRHSGGLYYSGE